MFKMNINRIVAFCFLLYDCIYAEPDTTCNNPLTSSLRDDQFSASSEYNTKHNASAARKDGEGWSAYRGGKYEYLKLDLESFFELSSLEVEGSNIGWYPRSFRISYSDDGYVWTGYNTRLSNDVMGQLFERQGAITEVTFDPVIKARFVAINPVTNYGYASLRIELYGCKSSNTLPSVSTNVQNGIEVNTTWIPNQSPILIHGNVVVRNLAVLTVQAGVKVIFTSESASIDVFGRLNFLVIYIRISKRYYQATNGQMWWVQRIGDGASVEESVDIYGVFTPFGTLSAEGIQGLPSLFSSNHPVLADRAKWRGINQGAGGRLYMNHALIRQAETGLQGNGSSMKVANCEIHSCRYGMRLAGGIADNVSNSNQLKENEMILLNVNVHDNKDGVIARGDTSRPFITFSYSNFDYNDDNGILVSNWDSSDSAIILTNLYIFNCSISHNLYYGIQSSQRIDSNIIIMNSTFVDNHRMGVYFYKYNYYYTYSAKGTLSISYSHFVKNRDTGINLYCRDCLPSEHVFHKNVFIENGNQALVVTLRMRSSGIESNIIISSNRFENNERRDIEIYLENRVKAYILNNYFAKSRTPVKLSGNALTYTEFSVMSQNVFDGHTSIYDDSVIEVEGITATISYTTFANSSLPTLVKFKDGLNHTFEFNRFMNTSLTSCFVRLDQKYDPKYTLKIDNNYWGTEEIMEIKTKICDFFFDSNKAVAKVANFYPTEAFETRVSSLDIDDFRINKSDAMNAVVIGGIIRSDINLSSIGNDRFIVNRSLLITDSANVNFKNVTVYFTSGRGIVVHGSLTIGDRYTPRSSILRSNSTNYWNGIKLYSKELQIINMEQSGTQRFIDVQGNDSKISLTNCNISDDRVLQELVFADNVNGNLSIAMYNTSVRSSSKVIYIKANDSRYISIEMLDSYVSSRSYVVQFHEATSHKDMRLVSVNIFNCSMYASGNRIFSLSSCSSHLYGSIKGSKINPYYYQDAAYFKFPSMNIDITENTFGDSNNILYFDFCRRQTDSSYIYPRVINISRNLFNSSRLGTDIWIQKSYSDERSHEIYIMGNEFGYKSFVKRKRLYARRVDYTHGYTSNDRHSLLVDSNLLANSTDVAVYVDNMFKRVIFRNNTFVNNSKCIHITNRLTLFEFNITENTFLNNTLTDGVIFLEKVFNNNTNIIDNKFINNTNSAIAFTSPNTTLKYNFFENGKDVYNLRAMSEEYPGKFVNASLNFWGTNDAKEISKTIYDQDYVDTLFDIEFRPYLGSKNKTDIRDDDIAFVSQNNEVGGRVNGEVTLKNVKSPYLVISNVEVEATDILYIEPGVVLVMKAGVGFKVYGEINILGTEGNPVRMLSEHVGKSWRGIDLRGTKKSSILYLHVNDTEEGIRIQNSNLSMHNITSKFSRQSGISIDVSMYKQEHFKMSEVTVENNGMDGINIAGLAPNITEITIELCIISNNLQYGINLETNATMYFEKCRIEKNKKSGIHLMQSDEGFLYINDSVVTGNTENAISGEISGGIVIKSSNITRHIIEHYDRWGYLRTSSYIDLIEAVNAKNILYITFFKVNFFENIADGIHISKRYYGRSGMYIDIENCTFSDGNRTLVFEDGSWRSTNHVNITFANNVVEGSILSHNQGNLVKMLFANSFNVVFNDNFFENNIAQTGLYVSVTTTYTNGKASIVENTFFNNNFSTSTIDIVKQMHLHMYRNIFKPVVGYDCILVAPKLNISYTLNATFNYWGSDSVKQVAKSVCGFENDMTKSYVWYIPFFANINLDRMITAEPNAWNLSGTFGGEITGNVTISRKNFPTHIRVDRSILIRKDSSFHLEAGFVLQFEKNRGIYVQGSLNLLGGDSQIILENAQETSSWYGVIVDSSPDTKASKTIIYNTRFHKIANGVVLHSQNVEIKKSQIIDSSSHCLTINQGLQLNAYDFEMSGLDNCSEYGIYVAGNGNISLKNIAINRTRFGIGLNTRYGSVDISHVNISESREEALTILFSDGSLSGNVSVDNCLISNCAKGIKVTAQTLRDNNIIDISRNTFVNISRKALDILPYNRYYYNNVNVNRTVNINLNSFTNSCGISLETWNNVNMTMNDNIFQNALCSDEDTCFLHALTHGNFINKRYRQYLISTNMFQNITCKCLVKLDDRDKPDATGDFVYNQLLDIRAKDTVILSNALNINMTRNIFDNPQSTFDLYAQKRGQESVNATNNWWGSSDANQVYNRIFDKRRDPYLITFAVTPVMTERVIDCSGVNNCSNHGECVSPNRCRCYSGWTGKECMDYDCSGVNNCYGNGDCTAPNTCKCYEGWSGQLCIVASCGLVNSCSGNGICFRPNVCTCAARFTGVDCSSCVPLHWGLQCEPCPDCQHGTCNLTNGFCECEEENWTGYLCDKCSETFYGPQCLPLTKVLDIVPNQGLDKGGNLVHVWGHNFPKSSTGNYSCKFGTTRTNGTWLAWNHVVCPAPKMTEGVVFLEISPDGIEFTNDKLTYYFYASCPPGSCGREGNPPHGQCMFGGCSCFLPYTGENCEKELFGPVISRSTLDVTLVEGASYSMQLNLTKGSPPILWSLLQGPSGMILDDQTGLVKWRHASAKSSVYTIKVKALNIIGDDSITWNISIPLSYTVLIDKLDPNDGILPVPKPVDIYGKASFSNKDGIRVVPIDISVISERTGRETLIQELSNPLAPTTFKTTYYPRPDDVGVFNVRARHPGSSLYMHSNLTWSVLGMRCEPMSVFVNEKIISDDGIVTVKNISSLRNIGKGIITGISAKIDGLPEAYARISGDIGGSQFELSSLAEKERVDFDLVIRNAKPLSGTIYIIFSTEAGTSTRLRINIKLSIRKPLLILDPPSLRENIVRGSIRVFDIKMNNTGEVAAKNVIVSLPKDPRLSLVSLSSSSVDEISSPSNVTVPPGGIALVSIAITTANTDALGEMKGTIYINTALSLTPFSYKFVITSLEKFNITFTVKDEYTYFAADSPLVSNAMVKLVNPRRGFSETKYTTNETGYVTFENVYEDQYSLYAEAEGHSTYAEVILVTSDTTEQDIFLQRVAVKYTWSVEPTTVKDVYIIQLDSTFETHVPMPVVTIEPAKVNTIPYELEEEDTIDFNITNHGLIRADNVRFNLPTGHPYLKFETTVDFIGSVEANTSIIVQVKATLKSRVKRNAAALAICGLALLYDYDCGGTQTRNLDVTLTREYPGRPPLPCGLGGGGDSRGGGVGGGGGVYYGGGGTGTGSGSSITYNPTTPLSCDCVKTLIKSCALAFHPVAGCAYAVTDLGTSYSRSNGDLILGTLNLILGLADTAFACVFGLKYTFLGLLYTTTRCLIDASFNCDGDRKRREISSDVVDNLISTAKPVDNFLIMLTEILGEREMYNFDYSVWYQTFKKSVGEDSEVGTMLSKDEAANVLNTLVDQAAKTNLSLFLDRWNNTAAAWENGTLNELSETSRVISLARLTPRIEQYLNDVESAGDRGFDSIFDEFGHATNTYKAAEQNEASDGSAAQKDDGVCARVRVRIIQELVLTRDAFNAKLEIENGENSDLESIAVEIHIKETFGSGELANDKFSIGKPSLIGISGVDGTGTLGKDLSGSAEWLIIPYSNAAPEDDTQYDIGGRLSYSVGGSEFSVPLLPDTINVKSNPSLVVHYFHEKYVQGDNALTPENEPSVPFSLAVMVMNNGYGVARALKITSGQPEIIENEKGLLVTFKIIGAQIGNNPIFPSLAVNFGDISSFETKTARWLMTSTLMGTFYNYSASFENINPLGDPQLSLLDELGYHELVHLVRIDIPTYDDGIDDFLVNDIIDNEGIPDKLYNSANGSNILNVNTANFTDVNVTIFNARKSYKFVTLTVKTKNSVWFYARIENTFTSPDSEMKEFLLHAHLYQNGRELLVDKNVWQTTHINDVFYLHLFDYVENNSANASISEMEIDYVLIYGPRNMYAPRFNSTTYSVKISKSLAVGSQVITIHAYDIDKDNIEFTFKNINTMEFDITSNSEMSAVIKVKVSPLKVGHVILEVIAKDSGIPPRYAHVNVSVSITDMAVTNTTSSTVSMPVTTKGQSTISTVASTTVSRTATSFSTTVSGKSSLEPSSFVPTTNTTGSNISVISDTTPPVTTYNTTTHTMTETRSSTEVDYQGTTESSFYKVNAETHLVCLVLFLNLLL